MRSRFQQQGGGRLTTLALACFATGAVLALVFATGWRKEQAKFGDFLVLLAPKPSIPVGSVLVGIDPSSLNLDQVPAEEIAASPSLTAMKAGYPWSRKVYADAIERLLQAGARLVFLDVMLRVPRDGDEEMRRVLEKYGDKVVLVSTFTEDAASSGQTIVRYQTPAQEVVGDSPAHVGFANFWRDEDQVVRVTPFRLRPPGMEESVSSAPAVMLGLLAGEDKLKTLPHEAAFIPGTDILRQRMIPLWNLFTQKEWDRNLRGGEVFRDKVVAIGAFFSDAHDEFQTPVGIMPGVAMHISALVAAWRGTFYSVPGSAAKALAAVLASLAAFLVGVTCRNILLRTLVYALGVALIVAGGVATLSLLHTQIPLLATLSGFLLAGISTLIVDLVAEGRERHRARRMLERYVSPALAREVLDTRDSFLESLGGSHRIATILFSDLRGFTSLAESADPAELLEQLNDYLGRMTGIVLASGGAVDKFLGDGILAVWGTLETTSADQSATPALECAAEMVRELAVLNESRLASGKPAWKLGIGVHRGPVIFGNVGSPQKMELTVIGDTVNLASRTESLNKTYGTEVLYTRAVVDSCHLPPSAHRSVDRIRVVGRGSAVDLFTPWLDSSSAEERTLHESMISAYRGGEFSLALQQLDTLLAINPSDPLYALYAERCREHLESPSSTPWEGVSRAKSK